MQRLNETLTQLKIVRSADQLTYTFYPPHGRPYSVSGDTPDKTAQMLQWWLGAQSAPKLTLQASCQAEAASEPTVVLPKVA